MGRSKRRRRTDSALPCRFLSILGFAILLLLVPGTARASDLSLEPDILIVMAAEGGLPMEFRSDGRGFFVVTRTAEKDATFLLFDSQAGTPRTVTVRPPASFSDFQLFCVDRIDSSQFVASAGWADGGAARNGLVFFGEDGTVSRHVSYGFTMRSIAASKELDLIAATIQGPRPAESVGPNAPAMFQTALFDLEGKLLERGSSCSTNRYVTFDEQLRAIRTRKPYFFRDTVMYSVPERSSRDTLSVIEALPVSSVLLGDRKARMKPTPRDYVDCAWLRPPIVEGVSEDRLRMLNVVPVLSGGRTALVAVWMVGEAGKDWTKPVLWNSGRALLALYESEGKRPTRWCYLPEGTYIGEITSTTDGRAFVISSTDITKGWSIAEVSF